MLAVEFGEELTTPPIKGGASGGASLPERIFCRLVDPGTGALRLLPFVQQGAQAITLLTPLHRCRIMGSDLFRSFDDLGAPGQCFNPSGLTLLDELLLPGGDPALELRDTGPECIEVTNCCGLVDGFLQGRQARVQISAR